MTKELSKRLVTAALLIPLVLILTLWSYTVPFAIGLYILTILGNKELTDMLKVAGEPVYVPVAMMGAFLVPLCFQFNNNGWILFGFLLVAIILVSFLVKMLSSDPINGTAGFVSINIFAAVFFPLFMSFLWLLKGLNSGGLWIIFLFCAVWASDSAAYFVGTKIGKRKIVPKISPNKSLEGFIGGIIAGVAISVVFYLIFLRSSGLALWKVSIIALDVVAAGILGDLFESMLKRQAGVKDSGNFFPGHGGIYDRLDSLIFAAPVLYIYLRAWL